MAEPVHWVGAPVRRVEDPRMLTGASRFVDDLDQTRVLHAAFVRSPFGAARIGSIDVAGALDVPGVRAAFCATDLDARGLLPVLDRPEFRAVEMPLLATSMARFAGEPIAIVIAESAYEAEDGAEAVAVDFDPVEAVSSIDAALAPGAPAVHDHVSDNVFLDVTLDDPQLEELLAGAPHLVQAEFATGRLAAAPMEGRAVSAEWDAREARLIVSISHQIPQLVRTAIADCLGFPEHRIRVVTRDVGGGFGLKCVVGREEIVVAAVARQLRRPVRWIEDRRENLSASFHGHEQRYRARAAFDSDGLLLGLDVDIACDVGAYSCYPFTCGVEPLMAATEMPGPYRLPRYRARTRAVATNKAPIAPYRGVSRPQITFVMERLMEKAASRIGLDPLEIRMRNLIAREEFPFTGVTGLIYDAGTYQESLAICADALGYGGWRVKQATERREGRLVGMGFACFSERTGYGTPAFAARRMRITPGYESADLRMDPSGGVTVAVGTLSHGQGHETTLAQILADELAIAPSSVRVVQGDTDVVPYGWGTFASRSMVIGGGAVKRAGELLAERLRRIGAHLLEAEPHDVELTDGRVRIRGSDRSVRIDEVARTAHHGAHRLPGDEEPALEVRAVFDPPGTFSNASHGAIVEVDVETGEVRVQLYAVAEDCGVVINPMIVEGQVHGGVAQGLGAALYEQLCFDGSGQLLTATFSDYQLPTAGEVPPIEVHHLETPSERSATGAKGMGEGGTIGAPAAVANAVADALAHLGIEFDEIPITPERVLAAIRAATQGEVTA